MKKILFGITSLGLGGAERVLVDLVNELSNRYEITVFTIYGKGELLKELNPTIHIKSLYEKAYEEYSKKEKMKIKLYLFFRKNKIYSTQIRKGLNDNYDMEVAFIEGQITRLLSVKNRNIRKVSWVHTDLYEFYNRNLESKIKRYIDKKMYSKYETIVFVSNDAKDQFEKVYKDLRDEMLKPIKKRVIYNYLSGENILNKAEEQIENPFKDKKVNFLSVARLVPPKGIERLIKIHVKLIKEGFDHNMYIIGDGPLKKPLKELIEYEKVEDTFFLLGAKINPYPYIKEADMFTLLSYFEGYGMVLEEAKILNKPILITNTGAREAIKEYTKGIIVENNEKAIYQELKKIIKDGKEKLKNTSDETQYQYSNQKIIEKIEKLIGE